MKKKVLFAIIFLFFILTIQFVFTNSVNAFEYKNYGDTGIQYYVNNSDTITVLKGENFTSTTLNVPQIIDGIQVTEVREFWNSPNLQEVVLPSGITTIKNRAFYGCSSLTSINLPDTITTIEDCAFEGCTALKSIVLPKNLKILEGAVFHNCSALTNVTLPNGLETIDFYIDTLTYRGYGAFEGCTSLKNITLPSTLKKIYPAAFEGTGFETITLTNSITNIDALLFFGCSNLTTFKMSDSVTSVQQYAFGGCPSLKELYFSKNINDISSSIFDIGPTGTCITPKGSTDLAKLTIYGYAGTVAETFAREKGIKFVALTDEPTFKDVKKTDWFFNAAEYCNSNKIITGYNDGRFAPNDKLSRGMLVAILYKMEGQPNVTEKSKFPDVQNSNEYYYKAIVWASNNHVVSGYSNGKFGPNDNITREDMAVILNRYAKFKGKDTSATSDLKDFKDTSQISSYALSQMKWAVGAGVITGNEDKTLSPKGKSTRAETAAMIEKYCKRVGR